MCAVIYRELVHRERCCGCGIGGSTLTLCVVLFVCLVALGDVTVLCIVSSVTEFILCCSFCRAGAVF